MPCTHVTCWRLLDAPAGVFLYSHMVRIHPATKVTPVMGLGLTNPTSSGSGSGLDGGGKEGGGGGGVAAAKDVETGSVSASAASLGSSSVRRAKEAVEGLEGGEREPLLSRSGQPA